MQAKIVKALQILINFLIVIISIWVVLYAFENSLPRLMGEDMYVRFYNWMSTTISISAIFVVILVVFYILGLISKRSD